MGPQLEILSGLSCITHDLPMFHDGPPHHTHQHCSKCFQMQRTHAKLSLCKGCGIAMYCSRECQVAHWPTHKAACKLAKEERHAIAEKCGIESAMPDLHAWMKYYDTPIKNCAIAALRLPENPHMERTEMLYIQLHHKGDSTLPVHDRFFVMAVGRRSLAELPPLSALRGTGTRYAENCERAKVELGDRFYGVGRVGFSVLFGANSNAVSEKLKHFPIDKISARANIVRQDWWMLFREYVEVGAKMKFCCGRLPGMDDICCCGGWVHDAEKREAFSSIGRQNA
ncbi:hypothetical protein C8R44DRAFT_786537 [Mycena epipterygia]|nr:hypothetical protein C8R44DRAFT_786537 [Mycena epipterygia]